MNLIEQQNMLKELSDGQLSQTMNAGIVPQYLVVSEAKRREDARKRYASLKQSYDAKQSIAQSVMQGLGSSMGSMMGGGAPGGLDAAMPPDMGGGMPPDMGGAPPDMGGGMPPDMGGLDAAMGGPPPGFARGGAIYRYASGTGSTGVDTGAALQALFGGAAPPAGINAAAAPAGPSALQASMQPLSYAYPDFTDPYSKLRELYAKQAGDIDKEKEQAAALALISAGVGIAGGKSQNFARNLAGAQDAITGYGTTLGALNDRQQSLTQAQENASVMGQQAQKQFKEDFRKSPEGMYQALTALGIDPNSEEGRYAIFSGEMPKPTGPAKPQPIVFGTNYDTGEEIAARLDPETGTYINDMTRKPVERFQVMTEEDRARRIADAKIASKEAWTPTTYARNVQDVKQGQMRADMITSTANKAQELAQSENITGPNSLLQLPGSKQKELQNYVATLRANIGFAELQAMRDRAANGASGLGQTTKNELDALQASFGVLDTTTDLASFMSSLEDIKAHYAALQQARRELFEYEAKELFSGERNPALEGDLFSTPAAGAPAAGAPAAPAAGAGTGATLRSLLTPPAQ